MDKKSKILFIVFFAAIFTSVGISFYRYYILEDYYIFAKKNCDPAKERCFMRECDPSSDGDCPEEGEKRTIYYKLIEKKANTIERCDPNDPACPAFDCIEEEGCVETLCNEETRAEEEICSDPETYLKETERKPDI